MAFVLLSIFTALLASLAVSALVLPLIVRGRFVYLPRSFIATQLSLAILLRSLVDLATYIWHLIPVYVVLALGPSLVFALLGSLSYSYGSVIFDNISAALDLLVDQTSSFSPLDIQDNVKESWDFMNTSFSDFAENANHTEIFQNVHFETSHNEANTLTQAFVDGFSSANIPLDELRRNLTISDNTQQFIDTINVAVLRFLENAQAENILNSSRIPSELFDSLHNLTEALHLLAKDLNFTDILKNGTLPSHTHASSIKLERALGISLHSVDLQKLLETAVLLPASEVHTNSSEHARLLSLLQNPSQYVLSGRSHDETFPWSEGVSRFTASNLPLLLLAAFLLFALVPLAFVLRAALQDGCLWLVTRRYKDAIPSEQGSVSGWMFVAAISGLAFAVTEAFPVCCILLYLHFSNENSNPWHIAFPIFHALKGAPLRTASHMRIAEGVTQKHIFKESEHGFTKAMIIAALFNGMFCIWWLFTTVALLPLPSALTALLFGVTIIADILIVVCSIAWGRRICRRVVDKEQRMIEEQNRKRD